MGGAAERKIKRGKRRGKGSGVGGPVWRSRLAQCQCQCRPAQSAPHASPASTATVTTTAASRTLHRAAPLLHQPLQLLQHAAMAKGVVMQSGLLVALAVVLAASPCLAERIPNGIGPFRVEMRSVNPCPAAERCLHPEKVNVENMKITKDPNNPYKYTYNADVNVSVPVDDSYKTEIRVSKWSSLGWTNNVFRMTVPNPCTAFKSHRPDMFKQVSDLYYGGSVTECPFPPVNALVRDFAVEAKPPSNVKSLPYGRFKARVKLMDPNQECVSCYDSILDILPKRRQ